MTSRTTERFRKAFQRLPEHIQQRAREAFETWRQDPFHQSLRFKQIHPNRPIYSVRIGLDWRALGVQEGEQMIWFWIGSHADYDRLVSRL